MTMLKESIGLIFICALDAISTYWLIEGGMATEANPLMNMALQHSWAMFFGIKGLTVALAVGFAEWYRQRDAAYSIRWLRLTIFLYITIWCGGVLAGNIANARA